MLGDISTPEAFPTCLTIITQNFFSCLKSNFYYFKGHLFLKLNLKDLPIYIKH